MSLVEELRAKAAEWYEAADNEEATAAKLTEVAEQAGARMRALAQARDFLAGKPEVESAHRHVEAMHNDAWSAHYSTRNEAADHQANAWVYRGYADQFALAAEQLGGDDDVATESVPDENPDEAAEAVEVVGLWRFEVTEAGIVVHFPDRAQGWLSVNSGPQYHVDPGQELDRVPGQILDLYDGRGTLRASIEVPNG